MPAVLACCGGYGGAFLGWSGVLFLDGNFRGIAMGAWTIPCMADLALGRFVILEYGEGNGENLDRELEPCNT